MEEANVTPELRFPEFENNWQTLSLYEMTSRIGDGIHGTPKYDEDGEYFFVNGNNLSNGKIVLTEATKKVSEEEHQRHYRELNDRTILMSINGTIGNLAYYNNEPVMLGKSAAYINILPDFELSYVFNYLSTRKIQAFYFSELTGSTIKNLSLKTIRQTKLHLPTDYHEQQKIASFLTAIDKRIQLLQKKKSKLKEYKKGVMQQLFSHEIRFKDENGNDFPDWEMKKLGEICKKAQSGGTPKSTNRNYYNGDIPFLAISDMTAQGKYLWHTTKSISYEGLENSSSWIVPSNSLIYSMYASVGFISINKIPIATSQAVMNIILNEGYELEFIYYFLLYFQAKIYRYIETGTQGNINAQIVKNILVPIPSLPEQQKIATFLTLLDNQIENCELVINNSQLFKKGLLQKMFL